MGLYKPRPTLSELLETNPNLLSAISIPESVDRSTLSALIIQETGELETIFINAAAAAAYLPYWSGSHLAAWNRVIAALDAEYDPIHNYDRTDTESEVINSARNENVSENGTVLGEENTSGEKTGASGKTASYSESGSDTEDSTRGRTASGTSSESSSSSNGGDDTVTESIQGFDSSTYSPSKQTQTAHGLTLSTSSSGQTGESETITDEIDRTNQRSGNTTEGNTASETEKRAGSRSETSAKSSTKSEQGNDERMKTLHSAGNIGVTTAQQMINAEIELRNRYNAYSIICEDFKRELCVAIW